MVLRRSASKVLDIYPGVTACLDRTPNERSPGRPPPLKKKRKKKREQHKSTAGSLVLIDLKFGTGVCPTCKKTLGTLTKCPLLVVGRRFDAWAFDGAFNLRQREREREREREKERERPERQRETRNRREKNVYSTRSRRFYMKSQLFTHQIQTSKDGYMNSSTLSRLVLSGATTLNNQYRILFEQERAIKTKKESFSSRSLVSQRDQRDKFKVFS